MIYLYECTSCGLSFEVNKPMADASCPEQCPDCGEKAVRKFTPLPFSVGWVLSEASHTRGNPDELVRNI
ncbi:unnamed protein product [marine sediment metagenome]|uniref:Putative regulatory protein FmdB zinc ribbon domain-containing protein n=1 Tax=marine sediment metagenome TaxID=412755 RepID=X1GTC9_9ZZZZ